LAQAILALHVDPLAHSAQSQMDLRLRPFGTLMVVALMHASLSEHNFAGQHLLKRPSRSRAAKAIGEQLRELVPVVPSDQIIEAVEKAGPRVTVADAAAAGGLSLDAARKGLVDLAAALGGNANIEVTREGELVYVFPDNPRQALSEISTLAAAQEAWNGAKGVVFTLLRSAFGVTLFVSIFLIFSAIFVLATAGSSDREDKSDSRSGGGEGGFSIDGGFVPSNVYYGSNPFELFYYNPYGYADYQRPPKMGFLESVFSFVFGDGDPNNGRDQAVLKAVASTARQNGGALIAEQIAPFVDAPSYRSSQDAMNVNESWVLDTVARLSGRPEVTKSGDIVYVFKDLQVSAQESPQSRGLDLLEEQEVPLSLADGDTLFWVVVFGAFNLLGAAYLGTQLASLPAGIILPAWLSFTKTIYPGLAAYALGFFAAPAIRYLSIQKQNSEIDERNQNRREWVKVLQSGQVDAKLAAARSMKQLQAPGIFETVYSTFKEAAPQRNAADQADFDRRLGRDGA